MNDTEALLKASVRERRRLSAMFIVLLVVITGTLGAAWMLEKGRGDSWRDQALQWQDEYVSLYEEFTVSTGEEPDAPDPSDVASDAPEAEPGAQGPPGPVGAAGPAGRAGRDGLDGGSPTAQQIAAAVANYCADGRCIGPAGTNGTNGLNGVDGAPGKDGTDSTVPGPAGPAGAAGPACPSGSTAQTVWVLIADTETDIPTSRQAVICVPSKNEGEPTP